MYYLGLLEKILEDFIDPIVVVIAIFAVYVLIVMYKLHRSSSLNDVWKTRFRLEVFIAIVAVLTLFYAHIEFTDRKINQSWGIIYNTSIILDTSGRSIRKFNALEYLAEKDKENLAGLNLSPIDISKINLQGANLMDANLRSVILYQANLSKAIFSGADLSNTDLRETNLIAANLFDANLMLAKLTQADLTGANLKEAKLFYINLTEANLKNAMLSASSFLGVDITRTKFEDSTVEEDPNTPKIKNEKIPLSWIRKGPREKEEYFPIHTPDNWNDSPKPNYICNWDFDISEHIKDRGVEVYREISEEQLKEMKEELKTILGDKCTLYEGQ